MSDRRRNYKYILTHDHMDREVDGNRDPLLLRRVRDAPGTVVKRRGTHNTSFPVKLSIA